ncbi:hypothetical protein [Streptomyces sp. NPDC002547]
MSNMSRICFEVDAGIARELRRLPDTRAQLAALTSHFERQWNLDQTPQTVYDDAALTTQSVQGASGTASEVNPESAMPGVADPVWSSVRSPDAAWQTGQPDGGRYLATLEGIPRPVVGGTAAENVGAGYQTGGLEGPTRRAVGPRVPRMLDLAGLERSVVRVLAVRQEQGAEEAGVRRGPESSGTVPSLSPYDMSVQECLTLLYGLREELFPQGIGPGGTVGDDVLGVHPQEGFLAPGPGWQYVDAWQTVSDAVARVGAGSAAFVLARRHSRVGHAFAAYRLPEGNEAGQDGRTVWIDLAAPVGGRTISDVPPVIAPAEARAIVIDRTARVVPNALPAFQASRSTGHQMVHPAVRHQYGAGSAHIADASRVAQEREAERVQDPQPASDTLQQEEMQEVGESQSASGSVDAEPLSEREAAPAQSDQQPSQTAAPRPQEPPASLGTLNPLVRSIAVPHGDLPDVPGFITVLKNTIDAKIQASRDLGRTARVTEAEWTELPHTLLSNYPHLLSAPGNSETGGLVVRLGGVEALIVLEADRFLGDDVGAAVDDPIAGQGSETPVEFAGHLSRSSRGGVQTDSTSGGLAAGRIAGSANFLAPGTDFYGGLRTGIGVTVAGNVVGQTAQRTRGTESAREVDHKEEAAVLVAFTIGYRFKIRTGTDQSWDGEWQTYNVAKPEKLLLWIPKTYLESITEEQEGKGHDTGEVAKLPRSYFATQLTRTPQLFDLALQTLKAALPSGEAKLLKIGSFAREKLRQQIYNLHANLSEATSSRGFLIALEDKFGRAAATVVIKSVLRPGAVPVGPASPTPVIDFAATAVSGTSIRSSISASQTLTLSAEASFKIPVISGFGFNISAAASRMQSDSTVSSATGSRVLIDRSKGPVNSYVLTLQHRVEVVSRNGKSKNPTTLANVVESETLLVVPQIEALWREYPVGKKVIGEKFRRAVNDYESGPRKSLEQKTAVEGDASRAHGNAAENVAEPSRVPRQNVPQHLAAQQGFGLAQIEVSELTINDLQQQVRDLVEAHGFLPKSSDNAFREVGRLTHGPDVESRSQNQRLLEKMISAESFASRWDDLFNDGLVIFFKRDRGLMGVSLDEDNAEVIVRATFVDAKFLRQVETKELVSVATRSSAAGSALAGEKSLSIGVKASVSYNALRSGALGFQGKRASGVSNSINRVASAPNIIAYSGPLDEILATIDFTIESKFSHSGLQGNIRSGIRDRNAEPLKGQKIMARFLPGHGRGHGHGHGHGQDFLSKEPMAADIFKDSFLLSLSSKGVRTAAVKELHSGTQSVSSSVQQTLTEATSHTNIATRFAEIVTTGVYVEDAQAGLIRNSLAAVQITARPNKARFEQVIDGITLAYGKSAQHEMASSVYTARTLAVGPVAATVGGSAAPHVEAGGVDATFGGDRKRSQGSSITGADTAILLRFGRGIVYSTTVDYQVRFVQNEVGKATPTGQKSADEALAARPVRFVVPEALALRYYMEDRLPLPPSHLKDAIQRWYEGKSEFDGGLVARLLTRWKKDGKEAEQVGWSTDELNRLAEKLTGLHRKDKAPLLDEKTLAEFRQAFNTEIEVRVFRLPDYLTRQKTGGRFLGHATATDITLTDGTATLMQRVLGLVERVAPGVLTNMARTADRRPIGTVQGATGNLQAVLATPEAFYTELSKAGGMKIRIVHPDGYFPRGNLEVTLSIRAVEEPKWRGFDPQSGLEVFRSGKIASDTSASHTRTQNVTVGKYAPEGPVVRGSGALSFSQSTQSSISHSSAATWEGAVQSWKGTGEYDQKLEVAAKVEVLGVAGERINNALLKARRIYTDRKESVISEAWPAQARIVVSESLLRSTPVHETLLHSAVPIGKLPRDTQVIGGRLDGIPTAANDLLRKMFGMRAFAPGAELQAMLNTLLSSTLLNIAVLEAAGGSVRLGNVLNPAHRSTYADLNMHVHLYDVQVRDRISGSGTTWTDKKFSGTSVTTGQSLLLPKISSDAGTTGMLPDTDKATWTVGAAPARPIALTDTTQTGTNAPGEAQVKVQTPLVRAIVRITGHLEGELYTTNVVPHLEPTLKDKFRSAEFVGELEIHIHEAQIAEIRARHATDRTTRPPSSVEWRPPRQFQQFDYVELRKDHAAQGGEYPGSTAMALAHVLKGKTRINPAWKILKDAGAVELARAVDESSHGLRLVVREDVPTGMAGALDLVLRDHHEVLTQPAANDGSNVIDTARQLAVILNNHVQVAIGDRPELWINPAGRVYGTRRRSQGTPSRYDLLTEQELDVGTAVDAGLLRHETRLQVELWRVDRPTLQRLYRTSWDDGRTLETQVQQEVQRREDRLRAHDLMPVFDVAREAEAYLPGFLESRTAREQISAEAGAPTLGAAEHQAIAARAALAQATSLRMNLTGIAASETVPDAENTSLLKGQSVWLNNLLEDLRGAAELVPTGLLEAAESWRVNTERTVLPLYEQQLATGEPARDLLQQAIDQRRQRLEALGLRRAFDASLGTLQAASRQRTGTRPADTEVPAGTAQMARALWMELTDVAASEETPAPETTVQLRNRGNELVGITGSTRDSDNAHARDMASEALAQSLAPTRLSAPEPSAHAQTLSEPEPAAASGAKSEDHLTTVARVNTEDAMMNGLRALLSDRLAQLAQNTDITLLWGTFSKDALADKTRRLFVKYLGDRRTDITMREVFAQRMASVHDTAPQGTAQRAAPAQAFLDSPRSSQTALQRTAADSAAPSPLQQSSPYPVRSEAQLPFRVRAELAKRTWEQAGPDGVAHLESLLQKQGSGARALVIGLVPDEPLWAFNIGGAIVWKYHRTAEDMLDPQAAPGSTVVSIDLAVSGDLIGTAAQRLVRAGASLSFCGLTLGRDVEHIL